MSVDYRLRRHWYRQQSRIPPEDVQTARRVLATFGRREGETDEEHRARLEIQNNAYAAEMDRLEELEAQQEQGD